VSYRALFQTVALIAVAFVVLAAGCGGRSGLERLSDDGGTDDVTTPPLACNASTCPGGCCDANRVCRSGGDNGACGAMGQACRDCTATGFESCDPTAQACRMKVAHCDSTDCAGCCSGDLCFAGSDPNMCGMRGQACGSCASNGLTCVGQQCQPPPPVRCGPANCNGCCLGPVTCLPGNVQTNCGTGGGQCVSCSSLAPQPEVCVILGGGRFGGLCQRQPPPACSAATCPKGCCDAFGNCQTGTAPRACGSGGGTCQNCGPLGEVCSNQQCAPPVSEGGACDGTTCPGGCCDAQGKCQVNGSATQCGFGGAACQNCAQGGEQCIKGQCFSVPDAAGCNAQTCPFGCCDGLGNCQPGFLPTQCGISGKMCQNCAQIGEQCDSKLQQCVFPVPTCDPLKNCPYGCCDTSGTCQPGSSDTACGNFGGACQSCTQMGSAQCVGQDCVLGVDAGPCSAATCPTGCCDDSGRCQQGVTSLQCGTQGANCANCLVLGGPYVCSAKQQCVPAPASDGGFACNMQTCQGGCCDASGICQQGFSSTQCGGGGRQCLDCTKLAGQCIGQACFAADGGMPCSQSCAGCCDGSGTCQGGVLNTQCGETGDACRDCTALKPASTCDLNVSPRVCASQQVQCPAPYPSCPSPLLQSSPPRQTVCSASDLQNAAAACSGGASAVTCSNFFGGSINTACRNCLQPFDVDFVAQSGIRACVAPFVDATCNHNSACIADCTAESCYGCSDPTTTTQCETQAQSGTCATYTQADQCVSTALAGPGSVCNPVTYQGSFGAWLQAVGTKYCGP
jgi:hypothetical protein